jgi:hypothetical protein
VQTQRRLRAVVPIQQLLIGLTGTLVGVIGWLFVGMYIQRRDARRHARNAGRAVYFELGANQLAIFTALEYGMFGPLSRASYDQLLPELATWLPADELQALVLAYLGQGGYAQVSGEASLPRRHVRPPSRRCSKRIGSHSSCCASGCSRKRRSRPWTATRAPRRQR